jgi:hypothetical protein
MDALVLCLRQPGAFVAAVQASVEQREAKARALAEGNLTGRCPCGRRRCSVQSVSSSATAARSYGRAMRRQQCASVLAVSFRPDGFSRRWARALAGFAAERRKSKISPIYLPNRSAPWRERPFPYPTGQSDVRSAALGGASCSVAPCTLACSRSASRNLIVPVNTSGIGPHDRQANKRYCRNR